VLARKAPSAGGGDAGNGPQGLMKAWLKQTDKEPVPGPVAVPDVGGGGALASDQGALKRLVEDVFEFDVVGGFRDYCEGTQVRFLQHTLALPLLYFTLLWRRCFPAVCRANRTQQTARAVLRSCIACRPEMEERACFDLCGMCVARTGVERRGGVSRREGRSRLAVVSIDAQRAEENTEKEGVERVEGGGAGVGTKCWGLEERAERDV